MSSGSGGGEAGADAVARGCVGRDTGSVWVGAIGVGTGGVRVALGPSSVGVGVNVCVAVAGSGIEISTACVGVAVWGPPSTNLATPGMVLTASMAKIAAMIRQAIIDRNAKTTTSLRLTRNLHPFPILRRTLNSGPGLYHD